MKSISKFKWDHFYGTMIGEFAVSRQRYTKEEALIIAKREMDWLPYKFLAIGDAYVVHRAGITEDNECYVGWWLEEKERKRSCPVWAFHVVEDMDRECYPEKYEYVEL